MNPRARFVRQFPLGAATIVLIGTVLITGLSLTTGPSHAQATRDASTAGSGACIGDNGGITLSPGFCATVFADKLGHARHLVVTPNGVVYVNTWSGRYYHDDTPPPGGFLIALQDTKGDGGADKIVRFGPTKAEGNAGGTGVAIYNGYVYAETNDRVVRYQLPSNGIEPTAAPETVVSGLPLTGDHPMHPFAIDTQGNLYVDLGSATNSCQSQNRMPNVPGNNPWSWRPEPAPGATMPTGWISISRPASALLRVSATARGSPSIPRAGSWRPCMAGTSSGRTGPSFTHCSRTPTCRPRNWSCSRKEAISVGRNAITMMSGKSSSSPRNTVVMEGRLWVSARRKKHRSRLSRPIGRPTIC